MSKSNHFSPVTIDKLQLKEAVTGAGIDRPVFIGYQDPIDVIKF
ncbi:hypothetical protein [Pseudoalteromonas sp. DL2-H2.2]|nr:hypothetical protein [Pseudoalteromonas sp. DL2-H2.2]